jgi:hypothetical protein
MKHPVNYQTDAGTAQLFPAGAAPRYIYGNVRNTQTIKDGSLVAVALASATTNTLTISGIWQVSDDNSTWINVVPQNNAARVAQVTGTGVAVTSTVAYEAPTAITSFKYVRFALASGVGVADGAADGGTIGYRWVLDR